MISGHSPVPKSSIASRTVTRLAPPVPTRQHGSVRRRRQAARLCATIRRSVWGGRHAGCPGVRQGYFRPSLQRRPAVGGGDHRHRQRRYRVAALSRLAGRRVAEPDAIAACAPGQRREPAASLCRTSCGTQKILKKGRGGRKCFDLRGETPAVADVARLRARPPGRRCAFARARSLALTRPMGAHLSELAALGNQQRAGICHQRVRASKMHNFRRFCEVPGCPCPTGGRLESRTCRRRH
jgi:hypothetical protein